MINMGFINYLGPPAMYVVYKLSFNTSTASLCKKSNFDPDNPPEEIREAAADMGVPVHKFKEMYMDEPDVCGALFRTHQRCVKYGNPVCGMYLEARDNDFRCSKFENKYPGLKSKY